MAAIDWPPTLMQRVAAAGFTGEAPTGGVRVEMDAGPPFQRQRFSAAPQRFSGSIIVDASEFQTFLTFWQVTSAHGTLPFNWIHPITNASVDAQFDASEPPSYQAISGEAFRINLTFEVLP